MSMIRDNIRAIQKQLFFIRQAILTHEKFQYNARLVEYSLTYGNKLHQLHLGMFSKQAIERHISQRYLKMMLLLNNLNHAALY
jgi:hypothetical protein